MKLSGHFVLASMCQVCIIYKKYRSVILAKRFIAPKVNGLFEPNPLIDDDAGDQHPENCESKNPGKGNHLYCLVDMNADIGQLRFNAHWTTKYQLFSRVDESPFGLVLHRTRDKKSCF